MMGKEEETRPLFSLELRKKIFEYLEEVRKAFYMAHPAAPEYKPSIEQRGINLILEAFLEM